jgi:hypothetical protein
MLITKIVYPKKVKFLIKIKVQEELTIRISGAAEQRPQALSVFFPGPGAERGWQRVSRGRR